MRIMKFIPYFFSTQKAQKTQEIGTIINIGIGLILILAFTVSAMARIPDLPAPGHQIQYDNNNYLIYEPARTSQDNDLKNDHRFEHIFTWHHDGAPMTTFSFYATCIDGFKYATPTQVWIVTHPGPRLDWAERYNLQTRKTEFVTPSLFKITDFDHVSRVVTNTRPAPEWMEYLNGRGIDVVYPDKETEASGNGNGNGNEGMNGGEASPQKEKAT